MLNRRVKRVLLALGMSLAIVSLTTGCSMLKKQPETESETEKQTEKQTAPESESETESETELQTEIAYTSQDKSIQITLPDDTWKVTQDADEMRVFSSGSAAMINIVHAADQTQMKNLSVSESEDALKESLTKQYPNANAFEVEDFKAATSGTLTIYEYVVKYNATSMWAYSVTYGIFAGNEAYVIQGTVTDDNKVLLAAVQKSVESFQVLNNTVFQAVKNGKLVQTQTESETTKGESEQDADTELKSLTDYSTSATLYANDDVNIRSTPSTESQENIIGSFSSGDQVTVIGETSSWFKVNVNGNIGYISKQFLVKNQPSTSTSQSETSASTGTDSTASDSTKVSAEMNSKVDYGSSTTLYTTTDVNVRSQPGTSSGLVDSLGSGQSLQVIGETDNWYVVSINGTTGYISKSYVSSTQSSTSGSSSTSGNSGSGNGSSGNNGSGNSGSGSSTSNTGTVSGTVIGTTMDSITIQGDDGNTYTINTSDANVSTTDGLYDGLYISANIDYSNSTSSGLYATSVTGH